MPPATPPRWTLTTHKGEEVHMVRVFHCDLLRAYKQNPRPPHTPEDTGYASVRNVIDLQGVLQARGLLQDTEYDPDGQHLWISIPAPDSPNYPTSRRLWNALHRKWVKLLDPETNPTIGE